MLVVLFFVRLIRLYPNKLIKMTERTCPLMNGTLSQWPQVRYFQRGYITYRFFFYCFVRGFLDIYFLFLKYKSLVWSKIHCFTFCLFCARLSNFYINTMYNSSFGFTSAISLNEKKKSFFSTLQPKHEVAAYVRIARPFYSSHLVIYTLTFCD